MKKQSSPIRLLNQGTYGCIFRPGINCLGKIESNSAYITKIQNDIKTSKNEYEIGKQIQKIPLWKKMYSPILTNCPISIGKIKDDAIEACNVIQKHKSKTFVSNKLRYVGKDTLEPYLLQYLSDKSSDFLKKMFQSHLYLLNSFDRLVDQKIVHYDCKENNIMYDPKLRLPIIIDFGLSFSVDQLTSYSAYKNVFYTYYDKYPPWCLDIVIISFLIREYAIYIQEHDTGGNNSGGKETKKADNPILPNEKTESTVWEMTIDYNILIEVVNHYFQENHIIQQIKKENSTFVGEYKEKWAKYIKDQYSGKKGEYVIQHLMESWKSWDNFAVSVMYYYILQNSDELMKQTAVKDYKQVLFENILSLPMNRDVPSVTINKIQHIIL